MRESPARWLALVVALLASCCSLAAAESWDWSRTDGRPVGSRALKSRLTADGHALLLNSQPTSPPGLLQSIAPDGQVAWAAPVLAAMTPASTSPLNLDVPGQACFATSESSAAVTTVRCFALSDGSPTLLRDYAVAGSEPLLRFHDGVGWMIVVTESCGTDDCHHLLRLDAANDVVRTDTFFTPSRTAFPGLLRNGEATLQQGGTMRVIRPDGTEQSVDLASLVPGFPVPTGGLVQPGTSYLLLTDDARTEYRLVALDGYTTVRWSMPRSAYGAPRRVGADLFLDASYGTPLVAIDEATGIERWSVFPPYAGTQLQQQASFVIAPSDALVLVTSRPNEIDVHALDRATGAGIAGPGRRIAQVHDIVYAVGVDADDTLHVITGQRISSTESRFEVHALRNASLRVTIMADGFEGSGR